MGDSNHYSDPHKDKRYVGVWEFHKSPPLLADFVLVSAILRAIHQLGRTTRPDNTSTCYALIGKAPLKRWPL